MLDAAAARAHDLRWKWMMLALCALGFFAVAANAADIFGLGGRPWWGWWDSTSRATGQPYVVSINSPRPGGAAALAGLRDGDRIDLREQSLRARVAAVFQLMASRPTEFVVHRGTHTFVARVVGSTSWEGAPVWKLPAKGLSIFAALWFLGCATLIVVRRWWVPQARALALVLLLELGTLLRAGNLVLPNVHLTLLLNVVGAACEAGALAILVHLSSGFGKRYAWRTALECVAYATCVVSFLPALLSVIGLATLRFDPLPCLSPNVIVAGPVASIWGAANGLAAVIITLTAAATVATTDISDRARTAWLILPLPVAIATVLIVRGFQGATGSWLGYTILVSLWNLVWLLGGLVVTYALLKRRVLDFEFVLGRTLVVGAVSLVVVGSFALLEWLLGTVLVGVSHTTGLLANGVLALLLGISLNPIHKRVDTLVDDVLFRRRRQDERALLDFSKEAAYMTQPGVLLDRAIAVLRNHTDARGAAFLAEGEGSSYVAARSYGDVGAALVDENDAAILALKTWHKPLDPHRYVTSLEGALALPMLGRGRLLGVLLLGERVGGEAYAPDEVEALSHLAHGVGAALDVLSVKGDGPRDARLEEIRDAIRALPDRLADVTRSLPDEIVGRLRAGNAQP
ncbi:MAG TPA: hypothetical protein VMF61_01360 [Candidatus Acidoferrales bacterium]|nr:hypothetical protein [Candidatus Acidoferrales bacterium]